MSKGDVYLMKYGNQYKIGVSSSVAQRLRNLNVATPFEIELVNTFETTMPYKLEQYLHHIFADQHTKGEWFALKDDHIDCIEETVKSFHDQLPPDSELENGDSVKLTVWDRYWICPLCDFLTSGPGLCAECAKANDARVVISTLIINPVRYYEIADEMSE